MDISLVLFSWYTLIVFWGIFWFVLVPLTLTYNSWINIIQYYCSTFIAFGAVFSIMISLPAVDSSPELVVVPIVFWVVTIWLSFALVMDLKCDKSVKRNMSNNLSFLRQKVPKNLVYFLPVLAMCGIFFL